MSFGKSQQKIVFHGSLKVDTFLWKHLQCLHNVYAFSVDIFFIVYREKIVRVIVGSLHRCGVVIIILKTL